MIVAHVVRQYSPSVGGLEEVVKNLVRHQLNAGLKPYIVTLNRVFNNPGQVLPDIEWIDGVKVIRIPYIGSNRYPVALQVLKHIKEADLVHVHAIDFFYDFLAFTKFIHRKKLVVSTHGGFFHTSYASKLKRIYFNTVTRLSALFYERVIGCSDNDGEIFREIISTDKLIVIENGVDIEKLASPAIKNNFASRVIYFGRWSVNKGLVEAVAFFSQLVKLDHENTWSFVIAGRPYDLNEDDIKRIASEQNVAEHIEVYSNPTDSELKVLVHESTYFLCLSKHEGFGIAPIEAMSAGLMPLLSNIPPFLKLIKTTGFGVVIDKDTVQMANEIISFHKDKPWSQMALIDSVSRYSWNSVGELYVNVYKRILANE